VSPLPTQFGRYLLIQALGSGDGVFLAVAGDEPLCVLRRPPSERRMDPEFLSRFRRAAHLARRLTHDGLVAVQDVGEVEDQPYLTEDFVEGHDLAELLQRCAAEARPIPVAAALHIGCAASRALGFLHEFDGLGLVHRTLRPANIRVGFEGEVKLLDLVSRRAAGGAPRSASVAEDLPYLAPEQLADGPVDGRADIYALGVVLWETLAGCPLLATIEGGQTGLARATREQAIERVRAHRPPPPSRFNPEVRPEVDAVVMRALAKAPEDRFSLASDMESGLLPAAGQVGRAAAARLMNRLFDASRERDERARATAVARGSSPVRAEPPDRLGLSGSSVADLRVPALNLSSAPVRASAVAQGNPAAAPLSVTTVVSHNSQWLRRFFLIFGAALIAAVAFNVHMTRRLDVEAAADSARALSAPPASQTTSLQAVPARVAGSPAAVSKPTGKPTGIPVGELSAQPPSRGAEPPPPIRPTRLAAAPVAPVVGAAEHVAGSAADLPADRSRPRAGGEGKRALAEARAAFESDDFSRAILQGRAALAAGEGGAHAILGAAYFKVGRYEDAVQEYGEALRLDPNNPALAKRVEIARRAASRHAEGAPP